MFSNTISLNFSKLPNQFTIIFNPLLPILPYAPTKTYKTNLNSNYVHARNPMLSIRIGVVFAAASTLNLAIVNRCVTPGAHHLQSALILTMELLVEIECT
jgi:hypothetical protein